MASNPFPKEASNPAFARQFAAQENASSLISHRTCTPNYFAWLCFQWFFFLCARESASARQRGNPVATSNRPSSGKNRTSCSWRKCRRVPASERGMMPSSERSQRTYFFRNTLRARRTSCPRKCRFFAPSRQAIYAVTARQRIATWAPLDTLSTPSGCYRTGHFSDLWRRIP